MPDREQSTPAPSPHIDPALWEEREGFRETLLRHVTATSANTTHSEVLADSTSISRLRTLKAGRTNGRRDPLRAACRPGRSPSPSGPPRAEVGGF